MEKASSVRFASHSNRSILAAVVGGLISWFIFTLSFLLILALIAYKNADPTRLIRPFAYTALCISAFVFGFTSGKLRGKQGAIVGMISGSTLTAIILIVSLLAGGSSMPIGMGCVLCMAVIGLATIGGMAGNKKAPKRKKRRRK